MEKNIIGEVKIPLLTREQFTKEKWETGDYILLDYYNREVTIVKEDYTHSYHRIDGYYICPVHGTVMGVVLYVLTKNDSQRPYLKKKKEISPRTLVSSYKYIHFIRRYGDDEVNYSAVLSNQETLAGSTFSLEIK